MPLDLEPPAHPGRQVLSAFFLVEDDPSAAARVEEHLLAGCIPCILESYESARRGFWEREEYHFFVVVSLDLAVLHLEQGRTEEVRRLAEEMLPVFGSCDIPKEAMQALALFLQAAATETVSAAAVRELTTRLRRAPRTVESADSPDPA